MGNNGGKIAVTFAGKRDHFAQGITAVSLLRAIEISNKSSILIIDTRHKYFRSTFIDSTNFKKSTTFHVPHSHKTSQCTIRSFSLNDRNSAINKSPLSAYIATVAHIIDYIITLARFPLKLGSTAGGLL